MSRTFHIRRVESLNEFQALAGTWNDLLAQAESNCLFLRWEWLFLWTKHYLGSDRLWILLVTDDRHRVRGIAPFYIRTLRRGPIRHLREIAFLGTEEVCSAYLDVIAAKPFKRQVLERIYRFLMEEGAAEWDVLTLEEIPVESSTIGTLTAAFEEAGKAVELVKATWCPVIRLPRCWTEYRRALSANARYNLQRKERLLQRLGSVSYRSLRKGPDVREAFDAFIALHETRWRLKGAAGGAFGQLRFAAFHRDIVKTFEEEGWLDVCLLMVAGRPVAGLYGFNYAGTYYLYLPGLNPTGVSSASPGLVLLARRIHQAIEEGQKAIDLLWGEAAYKGTWATDRRCALTLRGYNRSLRGGCFKLVDSLKQAVKIVWR